MSEDWLTTYMPTPNCALCKWAFCVIINEIPHCNCSAQGLRSTSEVYGNRYCFNLYQEEEDDLEYESNMENNIL